MCCRNQALGLALIAVGLGLMLSIVLTSCFLRVIVSLLLAGLGAAVSRR